MLEWIKVLGPLVISWPLAAIAIAFLFRRPLLKLLARFTDASNASAEIGPIKIALGKLAEEGQDAVTRVTRISELMAESRLLELEITSQMFGAVLTPEQRERMNQQISELRELRKKTA